ncbi:hypothetical protein IC575_024767 [Cucumis melo]
MTKTSSSTEPFSFLKPHGFENPQIANLVSRHPSIFQSGVSTNLKPKFEFLQEVGFGEPYLKAVALKSCNSDTTVPIIH